MTEIQEQDFTLRTFQLKAARVVAGMELKEIGNALGLTKAAISRWEHKNSFAPLTTSKENILILKRIFADHNIFFPNKNSISLCETILELKPEGLTRFQLRGARAILNITQEQLANYLNIPTQIITRAEFLRKSQYIRPSNIEVPMMLKNFFQSKNITFANNSTISFYEDQKTH